MSLEKEMSVIYRTDETIVYRLNDRQVLKVSEYNEHELIFLKKLESEVCIIKFEIDEYRSLLLPWLDPIDTLALEDVFRQCIDILCVLEKYSIVHLDFKPENMGLSQSGRITLFDFGNAYQLEDKLGVIDPSRYPPEKIRAPEFNEFHPSEFDTRADVWSLGAWIGYRLIGFWSDRPYLHVEDDVWQKRLSRMMETDFHQRVFASLIR
jgi:serine/threonine protein kinase